MKVPPRTAPVQPFTPKKDRQWTRPGVLTGSKLPRVSLPQPPCWDARRFSLSLVSSSVALPWSFLSLPLPHPTGWNPTEMSSLLDSCGWGYGNRASGTTTTHTKSPTNAMMAASQWCLTSFGSCEAGLYLVSSLFSLGLAKHLHRLNKASYKHMVTTRNIVF